MKIISKENFENFVNVLIEDDSLSVIGVKSKNDKFVFGPIESASELRLDYDVTLLSPKKYFFPQYETLITYDLVSGLARKGSAEIKPKIIIGIHPYDIIALLQMDEIFRETNSDPSYFERRKSSIIIGMNIQKMSKYGFSQSMGCSTVDSGYDLMMTDLGSRYAIEIGSKRGAKLLTKFAKNVSKAFARDIQMVGQKKQEPLKFTEQKLGFSPELIPTLLSKSYEENEFWERHAKTCLSCGSCVLVCPTCYCFNVFEELDLSLKKGARTRAWDGCLLEDFAKVASGENFRSKRHNRYRHRFFKKGKYLFNRFGFIACVGCGRCSSNCLPDIANPVNLFNDLHEEISKMEKQIIPENIPEINIPSKTIIDFIPKQATIVKKVPMTSHETLFEIKLDNGLNLDHKPGQFVEVSVIGVGEAPISVSSSPTKRGAFELCVRKVGNVTNKLHSLKIGDRIGIRGPFGNGFDTEFLKGKDLLFVAGGLGIVPLRSLLNYVLDNREDYGRVILLYGCKEPRELLFGDEILKLANRDDVEFKATVNWCPEDEIWTEDVGVITTLIPKVDFDPQKTFAIVVGPPIMYRFVINDLKSRNIPDDHIFVSLERKMKCGVGKCGHCQINQVYVCKDGPVFNYSELKELPEAL